MCVLVFYQMVYRGCKDVRAYLEKNPDSLGNSRGSLSRRDSGLYRTLCRMDLLDEFFPDTDQNNVARGSKAGRTVIPSSEVEMIISSYERFEGIACKAARSFGRSGGSISRIWRKEGLKVRGRGRIKQD
jgi:hypothetical protein